MAGGQDEAQRPDKAEAAGALPNEWSAASAPSQGDRQDPMPSPLFAGCKGVRPGQWRDERSLGGLLGVLALTGQSCHLNRRLESRNPSCSVSLWVDKNHQLVSVS